MKRLASLACAASLAIALVACSDDDNGNGPGDGTTDEYITAVTATINVPEVRLPPQFRNGRWEKAPFQRMASSLVLPPVQVTAVYHDGQPPSSTGGLETEGGLLSTPLVGQPFRYAVVASGAFSIVYLMVEGLDGYYQLTLPAGVTYLELAVTLANTPPSNQFEIQTLLGYEGGVSQPLVLNLQPGDLATADIAVKLTWTGQSDVDLWVVDGLGQTVAYFNPITDEGGSLDLDSNPDCMIDNVNQEIISWPEGAAPDGEYTVIVDYYSDCGIAQSPYQVQLAVRGRQTQVFNGGFNGLASENEQHTITVFNFP